MEAEALATLDYVHDLAFPKLSDSEADVNVSSTVTELELGLV